MKPVLYPIKSLLVFVFALTAFNTMANAGSHYQSTHPHHEYMHFMGPGAIKTVLKHSGRTQRKEIKQQHGELKDQMRAMARLKSQGAERKQIKQGYTRIREAKKELMATVKAVAESSAKIDQALTVNHENTMLTKYLLRKDEVAKEISERLGDDGEDLLEDLAEGREKLGELRKKIRQLKADEQYKKAYKTRQEKRKRFVAVQGDVGEIFSEHPQVRSEVLAGAREFLHHRHHEHKKHQHKKREKDGGCSNASDVEADKDAEQ